MSLSTLEHQLQMLEDQFNAVSSALVSGDPDALSISCAKLQQLTVELLQMTHGAGLSSLDATGRAKLQTLAQGLPVLRESLLRRSAYAERALALLVPQAQLSTYSDNNAPYGSGPRSSGQFKAFAA